MQKKKIADSEELYGELGRLFNFTQGDLDANRAGFLSFRQKEMKWRFINSTIAMILFFGILMIFFGSLLLYGMSNLEWAGNYFVYMIVSLLLLVAGTAILAMAGFEGVRIFRDIRNSRVERIQGTVELAQKSWLIRVGAEQLFAMTQRHVFKLNSLPYTFYVMPSTRVIVSVELALPE